jgi:hypothetical protein
MILLDTNVVSEVMRPAPDLAVIGWLNRQDASRIVVATFSIAEISNALHCLADRQRKSLLTDRFQQFLRRAFAYRILSFGEAAARVLDQRRQQLSAPEAGGRTRPRQRLGQRQHEKRQEVRQQARHQGSGCGRAGIMPAPMSSR